MCTVSMVMQHQYDWWRKRVPEPVTWPMPYTSPVPLPPPPSAVPLVTKEEIEEFRDLLERAREYDRKHNEPDCELEEKREQVRRVAKELGVEVEFV